MPDFSTFDALKRLQALADTGLVYASESYDQERYEEIKLISQQLMAKLSNAPLETIQSFYDMPSDYPTPKVDIRGLVQNEKKEILMVQESVDDKWTIPGGWADVGYTASEVVLKEIEEETGLQAKVDRLLAVYDKKCHPHPDQPYYVYKVVFRCTILGGNLTPAHDILDVGYFALDQLPPLSEDRILLSQLKALVSLEDGVVLFD